MMDNAGMPANGVSLELSERYEAGHYDQVALGLTKREHFAGLAMQGFISNHRSFSALLDGCQNPERQLASAAIDFADALLKELDK